MPRLVYRPLVTDGIRGAGATPDPDRCASRQSLRVMPTMSVAPAASAWRIASAIVVALKTRVAVKLTRQLWRRPVAPPLPPALPDPLAAAVVRLPGRRPRRAPV